MACGITGFEGHEGLTDSWTATMLVTTPTIRTDRLLLRGWREEDRGAFAALNADPRVTRYFASSLTRGDSDALVDAIRRCWDLRGYGLWAVERLDHGEFIGYVGLWPAAFEARFTPAVEVGWRLAHAHWGHGFATEGGREALRHGFEVAGLAEIVSFTAVANRRSWRVMERLGMRRDVDGDFEHPAMPPGHPARRHVLYRLTRQDWLGTPCG
jgi:RimJ/RimL family protein N-acetyltransferase